MTSQDHLTDLSQAEKKALLAQLLGRRASEKKRNHPVSFGQRSLWFLSRLAPESAAYNIVSPVRITVEIDVDALRRSVHALVARHPVLRTTYPALNGEPMQCINPVGHADFQIFDASQWSAKELQRRLEEEAHRPFDLAKGKVFRSLLFRCTASDHILLWVAHHIAGDFWSFMTLLRELGTLYAAEKNDTGERLPPMDYQYSDYVQWQRDLLEGTDGHRLRDYWLRQMEGAPSSLNLPTDLPRPPVQTFRGDGYTMRIGAELTRQLRDFSRLQDMTLYVVLLAAYYALLRRLTGQDDVVVGSPVAGRSRPEFQNIVGYFVNPVCLRIKPPGDPTVKDLLQYVAEIVSEALEHQDYPTSLLAERLHHARDPSTSPLFQTMFVLNRPHGLDESSVSFSGPSEAMARIELPELSLESVAVKQRTAMFDLTLTANDIGDDLLLSFQYNTDLFESSSVQRFAGYYEVLLRAIARGSDLVVSELPIITEVEAFELVREWSVGPPAMSLDAPVDRLIANRASRQPTAPAVTGASGTISYGVLDGRAEALARRLHALGVGPESRVALLLRRSPEMIVGILAVMKAGGAFVPVDPDHPPGRIRALLRDCAPAIVLCSSSVTKSIPRDLEPPITVEYVNPAEPEEPVEVAADDRFYAGNAEWRSRLAYVIYTSGSTGTPKGVMVQHGSLGNFVDWACGEYGLTPSDRVLQFASLSFDTSLEEIFPCLVSGGELVLRPDVLPPVRGFLARCDEMGITVLDLPTAYWHEIVQELDAQTFHLPASIRLVIIGGERARPERLARWLERVPGAVRLVNTYGPTESTVVTTISDLSLQDPVPTCGREVPIGRPIGGATTYVLDEHGGVVPVGIPGELHIGGTGVARGYLNRSELTAERFVKDPFASDSGARMYATGDVVRFRSDGQLEFLGRNDEQVKIRGYRVELGEVEAVLADHATVSDAVVMALPFSSGDARLVAYIVPAASALEELFGKRELALEEDEQALNTLVPVWREHMRAMVPQYMIPSVFMLLAAVPLTPTGKVDRRALPEPASQRQLSEPATPPRNVVEQVLGDAWKEVLGLEEVGVHDNFFDLGGHSFLILKVHERISKELKVDLTVVELFEFPTIATLAERLGGVSQAPTVLEDAIRRRAERPESAADEAIAIVGMAGRFPGAPTVEDFWQRLRGGEELIRQYTDEELKEARVPEYFTNDPHFVGAKGFLSEGDLFDADFFGYSPREAELMDPQHRLFLECAWTVVEIAGYVPGRFGGPVGVFGGAGRNTYQMNIDTRPDLAASARTVLGSDGDFLTTRVSYKLNLRGPSVNVQTACSTSLVAVHMACRSLRAYECDMALAGGVAYTGQAIVGHVYHDGGIMSRDGHCRPFDASASGTVSGNGVAIVALRRLSDALADGDIVHAVIRGSAINNDGSEKVGFTAPGVEGQSQVIAMALADAGVDPTTVAYVEAHGTGTALGDPIEVAALTRAYGPSSGTGPARWIGSVKSNVGHLDAAAGIAGLCKAVLCLKHGELVPTLNYKDQNQKIDFQKGGFSVVSERLSWEAPAGHPRRAAVSSFGMGGTNAHVVLEEAPARKPGAVVDGLQVLTLSARTDDRLEAASAELAGFLSLRPELPVSNVAHTLQTARTSFRHRKVVLARTGAEAVSALTGRGIVHVWKSTVRSDGGKVAFMFPGQGAQYEGMGRQLYDRDSEFRSTVDECAEKLGDVLGRDLREIIYSSGREGDRNEVLTARPLATQLALFVVELGLARQWMEWGIQPSACIGHSVGEYVAACVSGALELDDALGLLKVRGQLMKDAPDGAMVAVPLSEASLAGRLGEGVWLSAVNGPDACVVSGVPECVAELTTVLQSEGIECRRLHTGGAFHSGLMEGVVSPLVAAAGAVNVGRIGIPYVSNVTGEWVSSADLDATYWGRHVRQTVRFNDGLSCVLKDGVTVLLEVGPGNTLATLARRRLRGKERKEVTVLTSLRHARQDATEEETIGEAIGRLWGAGLEPRWLAYAGSQRQRVQLPTYPFARDRYWIEPGFANASPHRGAVQGRGELEAWFHVPVWKQVVPYAGKSPGERANPGPWLVFVGVHGVGDALAEALEARGHETIRVMPGSGYDKVGRHAYSLDPGSADAFRRLFEELASEGIVPRRIVHAWSMATGPEDGRAFDRGFYSLLYLLQAARAPEDDTLGATVLTNQTFSVAGEPVWHAERAGLLGLCMVAPQNVLGLRCYAVDLDAGAESVDLQALLRLIETPTAQVSALRNGRQFVRSLEPMPLPPVIEGHGALRFGGSYLITGGLGNVGRALARFLAEKVGAKLTLVSRSGLPSGIGEEHPRVSVVRELEAAGAEVLVAQADVTDGGQLTQAIAAAERRFGQIHGIVHAAGLTVGDTFKTLDALKREAFEEQFAAKWHGVRAIREALGDRVLDFCLVTSSLSVELGGLKMGAYAAANTIMDHLCEQFDRESATPWIAVDWDAWCFDDDLADDALAFVAEEGVETFERILAASTPSKVVVCTGDYATRLARSIPEGHVTAEGDIRHARPDLDSAYIAPRDQVEDAIGAVWADALGLAQVGAHDDFFELGGDSLMAVQLMPKLNSHFGVEIGLQALFESPTVSELAKRVHVLKRSLNATRQDEPDNGDRDELLL